MFHTVDINPGGNFEADAFSDVFINSHIDEYDLIMVPDCGGPWSILQNNSLPNEEQNINIEILITLCLNLTKMVKTRGIIQFGKFMNDSKIIVNGKFFNNFAEGLAHYLTENGFIVKNINNEIIIGQKML